MWTAIAGVANLLAGAFGLAFFPAWHFVLIAVGYGLLLPAMAVLHVRHQRVRESGAVLATAAGAVTIALGVAASANFDLVVAALFVRGIWWWTIGKIWAETRVLPRLFGLATMGLAVLTFGAAIATAPFATAVATLWTSERFFIGPWSLALAIALWRAR